MKNLARHTARIGLVAVALAALIAEDSLARGGGGGRGGRMRSGGGRATQSMGAYGCANSGSSGYRSGGYGQSRYGNRQSGYRQSGYGPTGYGMYATGNRAGSTVQQQIPQRTQRRLRNGSAGNSASSGLAQRQSRLNAMRSDGYGVTDSIGAATRTMSQRRMRNGSGSGQQRGKGRSRGSLGRGEASWSALGTSTDVGPTPFGILP